MSMDALVVDDLTEELRALIADYNAEPDPIEAARLIRRVRELRALLAELELSRPQD